ncbi:MAG TPA: N-acetylmuramoyl-L-alanine amidase [Solirubrobacteraceae bacterium]
MGTTRITRRSLIAAAGALAAEGAVRPYRALAQLVGAGASTSAALPYVASALQAGPGQPPIIARGAWAQGGAHPKVAPEYGTVKLAFVHHTENPDGYSPAEVPAMLRSIFDFHRYTRGWNDIGYNFVVDRFGRIFEARAGGVDEPVTGAQAGGYNAYSTGVAVLGTYGAQRISAAALAALEHLLAWKLSLHGAPIEGHVTVRVTPGGAVYSRFPAHTPVSLPRIAGHRDADSTDCPGDALYGELAVLRNAAARLAGRAARATMQARAERSGATPTLLSGVVRFLDGTPIAGAPVQVQSRTVARRGEIVSERVVAKLLTDADGGWSLPIALSSSSHPTALRALCTGGAGFPATISDPLSLPGAVSFGAPAAATPGAVSAPSAPASVPHAA